MAFTTAQRRAYQRICDKDSGRVLVIAMDQRNASSSSASSRTGR